MYYGIRTNSIFFSKWKTQPYSDCIIPTKADYLQHTDFEIEFGLLSRVVSKTVSYLILPLKTQVQIYLRRF